MCSTEVHRGGYTCGYKLAISDPKTKEDAVGA